MPAAAEVFHGKRVKEKVSLTGMRKAISERMHLSLQQMAQMTAFGKVDMSEAIKFRDSLLAHGEKLGIRITFTDIFVKVLSVVLKEMPLFNASLEEKQIIFWEDINIGVAVSLENGLIVPVIRGVGEKTILEIAKRRQELVDKARSKSLLPDDVTGGTFTLSNFGSYGGDTETAIINPPEVALMGVGKITDEAVVINGQIMIRPMMNFSFTTDHRLIDGATSGSFRGRFRELLESPAILLAALR
jgi:pyruvate/2-oxoglutarate dehydrogenase complex dihydrolipoamide acyltransferase (E2) component